MATNQPDRSGPLKAPPRKRNRVILNCLNCKRRKVKCDRQQPCLRCTKSGIDCEYQQPEWNHNDSNDIAQFQVQRLAVPMNHNQSTHDSEIQVLKDRIRELEAMNPPSKLQKTTTHAPTSADQIRNYKYDPENNPSFIGINPYSDSNEMINFYKDYNSIHISSVTRKYNAGPLSWLALMKKDLALLQSWKYFRAQRDEHLNKLKKVARNGQEPPSDIPMPTFEKFEPLNTPNGVKKKTFTSTVYAAENEFRAKAIDRDGFNDVRLYDNIQRTSNLRGQVPRSSEKPNPDESLSKIASMNKHGISLGLTVYEGNIDKEMQLIERLSMVLPKQKVVWKLINQFFAKVYPFMPIIDETEFKREIARVLGPEGYNETAVELTVEKRLDFAYLGILLVLLRITYLSFFLNRYEVNENNLNTTDPSVEAQELKYLLSHPIDITAVDLAQECLKQFDFIRKTNFTVLQGAFLLRLYSMFAPEDGDGADVGDSQTYNAMLVQMAISMGVNREPTTNTSVSNLDVIPEDLKGNNVQRKTWFFLVICDLIQGYKFGNPLCIDKKFYDTALPFYKPGNENIQDVELEKHVIGTFAYFERYYNKLVAILDAALDILKDVKLSELTSQVNEFELFLANNFGCLKDFLVPFDKKVYKYSFIKTMKCKNYINMRMFINTIFYHLFLYYEKQQNTEFAYFYLKKVLASHIGEFFPNLFHLIRDNYINFGEVADLILNPTIESMIHKVSQINFAIILRLNTSIYHMRHDPKHADKMDSSVEYRKKFAKISQIALRLRKIAEFLLMAMSELSQRYYYAWRVTKALVFLLKHANGDALYLNQKERVTFLDLNDEQLTELTNMIGTNLNKNNRTKKPSEDVFPAANKQEDGIKFTPTATPTPVPTSVATSTIPSTESNAGVTLTPPTSKSLNSQFDSVSTKPINIDAYFENFDWEKDLNIINNPEIDNLWLQMAEMKSRTSNEPINNTNYSFPNNNFNNYNENLAAGPNPLTPANTTSYNFNGDSSKLSTESDLSGFDLFDSLPFGRFFGS